MEKLHFEILQWLDTLEKGVKLSLISAEKNLPISEAKSIMEKDLEGLVYEDDGCWFTNISGSMLVRKIQTVKSNNIQQFEERGEAKQSNEIIISKDTTINKTIHLATEVDKYIDYIKTTKGYAWLKMKITSNTPNQFIVSNFNKLNELNPRQYSIDGEHKLTMEILLQFIKRELQNRLDYQSNHQGGNGNETKTTYNTISSANGENKEIIYTTISEIDRLWIESSFSFHWLYEQFEIGTSDQEIISLFNANHLDNPQRFSSHDGTKLDIQKLELYRKKYIKIKQKESKVLFNCENRMTAFHLIERYLSKVFSEARCLKNENVYIDYPNTIITIKEQNDSHK